MFFLIASSAIISTASNMGSFESSPSLVVVAHNLYDCNVFLVWL